MNSKCPCTSAKPKPLVPRGPPGLLEGDSLLLINASHRGDLRTVRALLLKGHVCANVCDRRGITPLFGASVRVCIATQLYD